ncbi:MAG: signal recognition particle protein Srp19 [Candidatus Bathyarchaeota archaeon]|nr:signal recognition particle protein Srp19 [Candidatus Bathyarchaeota archaeon]
MEVDGMRGRDKQVLWPVYFDADYSRLQGRRVPMNLASRGVKAEEIFKAAYDLGLNPVLLAGAAHPKHPWLKRGAVSVEKLGYKTRVVKDLARRIRGNRVTR